LILLKAGQTKKPERLSRGAYPIIGSKLNIIDASEGTNAQSIIEDKEKNLSGTTQLQNFFGGITS
jgi:hypothetical protein